MTRKQLDAEDRIEQHYKRLKTRDPRCVTCGNSNPVCLELHHVAGRKYHDDLAIVCGNCHSELSDKQHDHPPSSKKQGGTLETIGRYLLGLCDLLVLVVNTLREFGRWLIESDRKETAI